MKSYLGIDLAGEGGITGVAELVAAQDNLVYRFPPGPWTTASGLKRMVEHINRADKAAVDQPFSYPAAFMKWLLGPNDPLAEESAKYLWRNTDLTMQAVLKAIGLSTVYVQSTSRCSNIWRAIALATLSGISHQEACSGESRLIETHPRVAWAIVVESLAGRAAAQLLVSDYKGARPGEIEGIERQSRHREEMLTLLEQGGMLAPESPDDRERTCADDNDLDALMCAFVAYLSDSARAERCVSNTSEGILRLEGAALVPRTDWRLTR